MKSLIVLLLVLVVSYALLLRPQSPPREEGKLQASHDISSLSLSSPEQMIKQQKARLIKDTKNSEMHKKLEAWEKQWAAALPSEEEKNNRNRLTAELLGSAYRPLSLTDEQAAINNREAWIKSMSELTKDDELAPIDSLTEEDLDSLDLTQDPSADLSGWNEDLELTMQEQKKLNRAERDLSADQIAALQEWDRQSTGDFKADLERATRAGDYEYIRQAVETKTSETVQHMHENFPNESNPIVVIGHY
jgi:hypothetical protein